MPITVTCPHCDFSRKISEVAEGKEIRCQECGIIYIATVLPRKFSPNTSPQQTPARPDSVPRGRSRASSISTSQGAKKSPLLIWGIVGAIVISIFCCVGGVGGAIFFLWTPLTDSPDEAIARKHILERAHDPDSLEFVKWGPHGTIGNRPNEKIIRVIIRGKNLFGGKVRPC